MVMWMCRRNSGYRFDIKQVSEEKELMGERESWETKRGVGLAKTWILRTNQAHCLTRKEKLVESGKDEEQDDDGFSELEPIATTGKKFMNEKLSMDMTSSFFVVSTKFLSPGSNSELWPQVRLYATERYNRAIWLRLVRDKCLYPVSMLLKHHITILKWIHNEK